MILFLCILSILLVTLIVIHQKLLCPEEVKVTSLVAIIYFFMSVGPSIAYLLGDRIYFGIRVDKMDEALLVSVLGLTALFMANVTYLGFRGRARPVSYRFVPSDSVIRITAAVLLGTSLIMSALMLMNLHKFNLDKVTKVQSVAFIHYKLILLWMAAFAVYFANKWELDRVLLTSFGLFTAYCLLFSERDFVFILLAMLFVHLKGRILNPRLFLFGVPGAMALTRLTAGRGEIFEGSTVSAFFNQGSNLFVNSFVIELVEDKGYPLQWGQTYLSSLLDSISFGRLRLDAPLAEWLVGEYTGNPDAAAGYGFSLEAEAFLNFGYPGVLMLYFLLGLLMVHASQKAMSGDYLARLHVMWALIFMIYGLRGESLNILKPYIYCWVIILLARILAPMFKKPQPVVEMFRPYQPPLSRRLQP
ncbi:MAG: O-antigen polysaccharide polymerase Wzy [Thiothrix sp.]|nr:O-antigen polysaccharide polymerase Wzy [Thiothrix sp.]HPQ95330.1 hypothetical protein [Thiolinea sp.]